MPVKLRVVPLLLVVLAIESCAATANAPVAQQSKQAGLHNVGGNEIIGLDLMSVRNGHGGPQYFPIDGDPVAGNPYVLEVQIYKGATSVALEMRDLAGQLISTTRLERTRPPDWPDHTKHWGARLTLPAQSARLYVIGVMEDGQEFRTGSRTVDAKTFEVRMGYVPSIIGGRPLDYEIELQNFGAPDRFEVTVTDDAQFLAAPVKAEVALAQKESRTITVKLDLPVADEATTNMESHIYVAVRSLNLGTTGGAYGSISLLPGRDADADLVGDDLDNCPSITNPPQADQDQDGIGDECDPEPTKAAKTKKG